MIGCTKLLCGKATVSDAIKYAKSSSTEIPPHMLQFSTKNRPIVVWNMTLRCNLRCVHCYINAKNEASREELTTEQAKEFIEDLGNMKVPVLLFSGGEPLLRDDFFELAEFARDVGLRTVISTNGTLIDEEIAKKLKDVGIKYVGVSLDGMHDTHNKFRGLTHAFEKAIEGIKNSLKVGLKAGIRFTVTKDNYRDLPKLLEYAVKEGIPRFCIYHLVYAGRGKHIVERDLTKEERRKMMEFIIEKTLEFHKKGYEIEILTTDNHADGVFLYNYVVKREPERAKEIITLLKMHGGCSAGVKVANVDYKGDVHPCQFWSHVTLGNVKEKKFSEIWNSEENEFLNMLRNKTKYLKGKCGRCSFKELCGGCRIRAETVYGDVWQEDPSCYLTEEEISGKAVEIKVDL